MSTPETMGDDAPRTKSIELRKPIKLGDIKYDTLELREPTLGEMDKAAKAAGSRFGSDIELLSLITNIPTLGIKQIGVSEYNEALKFISVFTNAGQPTGET